MVLSRDAVLFPRDEKGELIPQEVTLVINEDDEKQLKYKGETIVIVPMIKAELKKAFDRVGKVDGTETDIDGEIVLKYCKNPKFTAEDLPYMKGLAAAIVNTILFESGVDVLKNRKKAVDKKEDDFVKNSG